MVEELGGSNPMLRRIRRLARDRGFRWAEASYVVEGPTLVTEAIESGVDRYLLRWETLGANRDQPRDEIPPPSALRLYALANED